MTNSDGLLDAATTLELADWRRRIAELYAEVRGARDPRTAYERWRSVREELFRTHAASPIPPGDRAAYEGIPCFPHDPSARVLGRIEPATPERFDIADSGDGSFAFRRVGRVRFELHGRESALDLFWMEGYAGGFFLPFLDATSGDETYGGGRYLLDTVKGADHGVEGDALVLDFNLAYPPSCSYDPRWVCPLAPPGSRLSVPVRAGERSPRSARLT